MHPAPGRALSEPPPRRYDPDMAEDDPQSLVVSILREIRDEIRKTNGRVDQTNSHLDQTNSRLDRTNELVASLERRQTETEIRLATEIVAVASAVRDLSELIREDRALRNTVDEHDKRISTLERKVG